MVRKTGFAHVPHNPELCDYIIIYFLSYLCILKWLPELDLNQYKESQSLLCYHYTIGQLKLERVAGIEPA